MGTRRTTPSKTHVILNFTSMTFPLTLYTRGKIEDKDEDEEEKEKVATVKEVSTECRGKIDGYVVFSLSLSFSLSLTLTFIFHC